ncbi:Superfamily I DNA and RNA helicase-like protein [Kribbella flavida DSM 17836]|uniref:Superfamily I DNA and RNA helicase-like protein n=1 Tax=Kribbella flavida (strain DSM 17836 / JCM 10339 / NBRC 14399) TaxID=479435 RepID=D2PVB2_KRIFD|nr:AAA family ATPase [Kribbella flavida]ADB33393.1 Superfamily I DNA and RNA helicase-like protein [Kribbella flavida DSM 17836]
MRGLEEERRYADRCRDALRAMIAGARQNVVVGEDTWGDRYTAERLGYHLKSLARELADEGDGPPFFGLVGYRDDEQAQEHRGQLYYLGRRHISDAIGRPPLVIDWRAPVATTFYRATAEDPQGIAVRRRFGWSGEKLTSLEDESLAGAEHTAEGGNEQERTDGSRSTGGVDGARGIGGILRAEIERPRVGPMRDIVATIQPEQDELVRAELAESICVQGAPGTGKTAVGLHRAAYLLYAYRSRLQRSGVLVLGPNQAFLQYISAVLPTLGEVDVEQTTIDQLLAVGIDATDLPEAAAVKHDARMAEVLRRVLYRRIGTPTEAVVVPDGSYRWRVNQYEFEQLVDEARAEATAYGVGRERVVSRLVAALQRQAETRGQNCNRVWQRRMARAVSPAVEAVWPVAKAAEVLAEFLSDPFRSEAGESNRDGGLSSEELAAIAWKRPRKAKSARWTAADAVLLDELAALIARGPGYGLVIVDEAQDLSPMQCRAIARRSEHGSLTVLGDLAQGTTAWAARSWAEQLTHLGKPDAEVVALTTGYRVPAAVVAMANRLLEVLAVEQAIDVPATRSFRSDGRLVVQRVDDLAGSCVDAARAALKEEGSIGVIAADHAVAGLTDVLRAEDLVADRLTVVPASLAKGLEYDHVIVVEPADVVEAEPRGMNRLYVVLTRAVSRLDVLHHRPLPIGLT